ncbi:MAG TPA: DUF1735 domain-containing protein [Niastella sp.]|nr:DUF1735 domain-containing protein [Niastella sp.]
MKQLKISLSFSVLLGLVLTSCLKENHQNIDPDRSLDIVEFANSGSNTSSLSKSTYPGYYTDLGTLLSGESATFNLNVNFSGATEAPEDVTVNIEVDTAALTIYNEQNGTNYVVPSTDIYTLPTSIVIKKGTRIAQSQVTITNTSNFSFDDAYALPLKITSASKGAISANFGKAVFAFGVRNKYDGHYSMKGYSLRGGDAVKTGNFQRGAGMDLVTIGANAVQFGELQVWADLTGVGVGNPIITVNEDNSLTLSSDGGIMNAPGYDSRYDPATKTFYLSFTWGAGPSARLAVDTLTYIDVR